MLELLVFISDFHFGRKTAGWNAKTAQQTLKRITDKIKAIADDIKPSCIRINFLGDIMDGEGVYSEQSFELELVGFEQVYEGARVFTEALIEPLSASCNIVLDGVPGNHAYLRFANRRTNLDNFFYATLEQLIKEHRLTNRIRSDFWVRKQNEAIEMKVTSGNFKVLIGHGHFLKSVFPFSTGMERKVLTWLATFNQEFQLAAFGHFHRFGFIMLPSKISVLFNGCMLLYDEFSLTRYGHHGDRTWAAISVSGKRILNLHLLTDETLQKGQFPKISSVLTKIHHDDNKQKP